ncbi:MAG TPA: hypothetical protein VEU07_09325, partial [Candidatus Acidoferrum sp.]|nr:hypothetical protein [Candidatus Acidoferrum sp.]
VPAPARPCRTDDALIMAIVPHACGLHAYPLRNNRVAGSAEQEPKEGSTFVRSPGDRIRFKGTLGEAVAPARALEYIRLADGKRSVREIAALAALQQGLDPTVDEADVAAVFRGLFGMTSLLVPDVARCDGCPLRAEATCACELRGGTA